MQTDRGPVAVDDRMAARRITGSPTSAASEFIAALKEYRRLVDARGPLSHEAKAARLRIESARRKVEDEARRPA